jgi:hypothetical protein
LRAGLLPVIRQLRFAVVFYRLFDERTEFRRTATCNQSTIGVSANFNRFRPIFHRHFDELRFADGLLSAFRRIAICGGYPLSASTNRPRLSGRFSTGTSMNSDSDSRAGLLPAFLRTDDDFLIALGVSINSTLAATIIYRNAIFERTVLER